MLDVPEIYDYLKAILIIAAIALAIGLFILGVVQEAKRRKAILAWCEVNHLQFDPASSDDPGAEYSQTAMMQEGERRYGNNWCMGKWQGRQLCYFDYHYTTGSGKSRTPHTLSVMTIESGTHLKPLTIRPEGLLDRVGEFFGAQEIHFESAEFTRRFHVSCEDRKWAYDVLPPRALELLLSGGRDLHVQFDDESVVLWDGKLWPPEDIGQAAKIVSGLLDLMPAFATQETTK